MFICASRLIINNIDITTNHCLSYFFDICFLGRTIHYNKSISQEKEDEVLKGLKDEGCNVVEVSDLAPWREACAKVIEDNTSSQADLYQQLLDLAK